MADTPRDVMLAKLETGDVFGFGESADYDCYPGEEATVDGLLAALSDAGYEIVERGNGPDTATPPRHP